MLHFSSIEYTPSRPTFIAIKDIAEETDTEFLHEVYDSAICQKVDLTSLIEGLVTGGVEIDIERVDKLRHKLARVGVLLRHTEKRLIELEERPGYWPTDPRTKELHFLNNKIKDLLKRIKAYEDGESGNETSTPSEDDGK